MAIGKYAAMQRLQWRGHVLLFHRIFNSNLRKSFYSRLKRGRECRKEIVKRGICPYERKV